MRRVLVLDPSLGRERRLQLRLTVVAIEFGQLLLNELGRPLLLLNVLIDVGIANFLGRAGHIILEHHLLQVTALYVV